MTQDPKETELAQKSLETLLEKLGFSGNIVQEFTPEGVCFQIMDSPDAQYITGEEGDRLDDLQYLVNRLVQKKIPEAVRVRVDCDHFRARNEKRLVDKAVSMARRVLETGKPMKMSPLNAYHRRLVHNALMEIEGVRTESPNTDERFKRITILKA